MSGYVPQLDLKKYACPVCPKRFDALKDKKVHIRTEHPRPKD